MESNLDLVSTDELISALQRRFDYTIFMGKKITGFDIQKQTWTTKRRFSGNPFMACGLASNMEAFLNGVIAVTEEPTTGQGT